jgi:Bacterial RNA polymerase, alpha chain C terminal domain/Sigma-70, region 4
LAEGDLLKFQNCGRKTVRELRESLAELGLGFGIALDQRNRPISPECSPTSDTKGTILAALDENTRTKLYLRVDELGLSPRAEHVLKAANIEFVGDLVGWTEIQIRRLYSCGRLTVTEIKNKLKELDLRFGLLLSDWSAESARKIRALQDSDRDSRIASLRHGLNTIPPSKFLEDELRAILASVASDRDTDIILKQLGWSGEGHRTLESVGQEYSVTRERIRQIVARASDKIRKEYVDTPRLDEALPIIRDRCPATAATLAAELRARGLSQHDFDPTGLETACDILQREFGLERIYLRHARVYVAAEHANRTIEFFQICRRLTSSQGCANFDVMCDELRVSQAERQRFRELATIESMCEWLDPDRKWLFSTGVTRNRLSNLVAKVLCVAPHVYLTELRKAVARSRRLVIVPPVGILANFMERFDLASVSDGRASAIADFSDAVAPGSAESIFVSVLRMHGPILGWDRLQELCIAAGMNPITFGIYVSGSPIIARVTRGIYSLVGADIPPGAVEDLEREVANSRKPAEWGWSPRGTLWYALPITGTVLGSGSVAVTQFVADIVDGEWKACFDRRELGGNVKCSNRFLWDLRRPLIKAGAELGDVAILEFDLPKRTVNITLGGEELADIWESGDIDLPAPESGETEAEDGVEETSPDN